MHHECNLSHKIAHLEKQLTDLTRTLVQNENQLERENQQLKRYIRTLEKQIQKKDALIEYKNITHFTSIQMETHIDDAQQTIILLREELKKAQLSNQMIAEQMYTEHQQNMKQQHIIINKMPSEEKRISQLQEENQRLIEENQQTKLQNQKLNDNISSLLMRLDQATNQFNEEQNNKQNLIEHLNNQNQVIEGLRKQLQEKNTVEEEIQTEQRYNNNFVQKEQENNKNAEIMVQLQRKEQEYKILLQKYRSLKEQNNILTQEKICLKEQIKQIELISLKIQEQMQSKYLRMQQQLKVENTQMKQKIDKSKIEIQALENQFHQNKKLIKNFQSSQILQNTLINDLLPFSPKKNEQKNIIVDLGKSKIIQQYANQNQQLKKQLLIIQSKYKQISLINDRLTQNYHNIHIQLQEIKLSKNKLTQQVIFLKEINQLLSKKINQQSQKYLQIKSQFDNYKISKEKEQLLKRQESQLLLKSNSELMQRNYLLSNQIESIKCQIKDLTFKYQEAKQFYTITIDQKNKGQILISSYQNEVNKLKLNYQQTKNLYDNISQKNKQLQTEFTISKENASKQNTILAQTNADLLNVLSFLKEEKTALINQFQQQMQQIKNQQKKYQQAQLIYQQKLDQQIRLRQLEKQDKKKYLQQNTIVVETNKDLLNILELLRQQKEILNSQIKELKEKIKNQQNILFQSQVIYKQKTSAIEQEKQKQIQILQHKYNQFKSANSKENLILIEKTKDLENTLELLAKEKQFLKKQIQHKRQIQRKNKQSFSQLQARLQSLKIKNELQQRNDILETNSILLKKRFEEETRNYHQQLKQFSQSKEKKISQMQSAFKQQLQEQKQHHQRQIRLLTLFLEEKLSKQLQQQKDIFEKQQKSKEKHWRNQKQILQNELQQMKQKQQYAKLLQKKNQNQMNRELRNLKESNKIQTSSVIEQLKSQIKNYHYQLNRLYSEKQSFNNIKQIQIRQLHQKNYLQRCSLNQERKKFNELYYQNLFLKNNVQSIQSQLIQLKNNLLASQSEIKLLRQSLLKSNNSLQEQMNKRLSFESEIQFLHSQNNRLQKSARFAQFDSSLTVARQQVAKYKRTIMSYELNLSHLRQVVQKRLMSQRKNKENAYEQSSQWCIMQAAGLINKLAAECTRLKSELVNSASERVLFQLEGHTKRSQKNTKRQGIRKEDIQKMSEERRNALENIKKELSSR